MQRRDFILHAGALAGSAALGQLGVLASRAGVAGAAAAGGYQALVCIFMYGGNDSNNMIVPIDSAGYSAYAQVRPTIALPQGQLLPLQEPAGVLRYGMHPSLPGLQGLWNAGNLAVVANVGPLVQPLTKAQYLSPSTQKPASLFSHIDQQHEWQASISDTSSNTGWGGRLSDQFNTLNAGASVPPMISTAGGNNLFVTGAASQALVIPVSGSFGLSGFSSSAADQARRSALANLLNLDQGADLTAAAQDVMTQALSSSATLNPILTATNSAVSQAFSGLTTTNFSQQMLAIAKLIEASSTLGAQRQVFLATIGSFDTHTDQLNRQQALFLQLDPALAAFQSAMAAIGAASNVTTFTLSDFSRTLQANTGGGTDHAWGSHHLVIGGAVRGGQLYGTMPTLALGGPDDVGSEGRWIPTVAVDQYAATLASWFGADATALATVLPNLAAFSPSTVGFI
jgi:uncharacterized protein (DUF1501 family)